MDIGSRIYQQRKKLNWTQNQLAEAVGVSFQAVSSWERGEYLPDTEKLRDIARALQKNLSYFLDEDQPVEVNWHLHDRVFSEERMYTFVKAAAATAGLHQTLKALPFAKAKHDGQVRKGSDHVPYINHPLTMACHVLAMDIKDDDILAAILLHDVVEDCGVSLNELPVGDAVRDTVDRLTHTWPEGKVSDGDKLKNYERIIESPDASFVKVIDRCNNLSMMATGFPRTKMVAYIVETEKYVFPLIGKLKDEQPQYSNALFLVKYQMLSVMETLKRLLI